MPRVKQADLDPVSKPSIFMDCPVCGDYYQILRPGGVLHAKRSGSVKGRARELPGIYLLHSRCATGHGWHREDTMLKIVPDDTHVCD